MRVIGVIDERRVVEKILRYLGAWHDLPPRPPPGSVPGPYTYEQCEDEDPMPDYENVLTDWARLTSSHLATGGVRPVTGISAQATGQAARSRAFHPAFGVPARGGASAPLAKTGRQAGRGNFT